MSAICTQAQIDKYISPITISGIEMNTWHDKNQVILRLFKPPTLVDGIVRYALQECNRSTIKDKAQFERLIDKNFVFFLTNEGKLISFSNSGIEGEAEACLYYLHKGADVTVLRPNCVFSMTNPKAVETAKAVLKKFAVLFDTSIKAT